MLLDILIAEPGPLSTATAVMAYLGLSLLLGSVLRRGFAQNAAFGFLLLGGGANLALFTLRALDGSTGWLGPLALAYAAIGAAILRLGVLTEPFRPPPLTWADALLIAPVLLGLWAVAMIQVEPSSGLSSHLGWVPQYVKASFALGQFVQPDDLAAGQGLMVAISYVADALGLVGLAAWVGMGDLYPAYHATSILASGLAFVVVARRFGGHFLVMAAFVALCAAMAAADPLFRTVLLRHWGDTFMVLSGALMLTSLSAKNAEQAWKAAAAAAIFAVFSRHYAMLYGGMVIMLGWYLIAIRNHRPWRPWIVLGILACILASREIWCLLTQPSPWYPGSQLLATAPGGWEYWVTGTLHDLGIMTAGAFSLPAMAVRALYLPAMVIAAILAWRQGPWLLRPLLVMALPFTLEIITGYRTPSDINKLLIVIVLLPAFVPAWVLLHSGWQPAFGMRLPARAGLVAGGLAIAAFVALSGPMGVVADSMRELYRSKNVDRSVALAMAAQLGGRVEAEAQRPIVYVSFEPGMGLRNFIGGDVTRDLDWQGETVLAQVADAADLGNLVARLGHPNIYIGFDRIYPGFDRPGRDRLEAELFAPLAGKPWVEAEIAAGTGRFIVTRAP